jgi:phosphatidylglycerophosphate synthase
VVAVIVVRGVTSRRAAARRDLSTGAGLVDPPEAPEVAARRVGLVRDIVPARFGGRRSAIAIFGARCGLTVAAAVCAGLSLPLATAILLALALVAKPLQTRLRPGSQSPFWTEPTLDRVTVLVVTTGFTVGGFFPWQILVLLLLPEVLVGGATVLALRGVLPLRITRAERVRAALQLIGLTSLAVGISGWYRLPSSFGPDLIVLAGELMLVAGLVLSYVVAMSQARDLLAVWQVRQTASPG